MEFIENSEVECISESVSDMTLSNVKNESSASYDSDASSISDVSLSSALGKQQKKSVSDNDLSAYSIQSDSSSRVLDRPIPAKRKSLVMKNDIGALQTVTPASLGQHTIPTLQRYNLQKPSSILNIVQDDFESSGSSESESNLYSSEEDSQQRTYSYHDDFHSDVTSTKSLHKPPSTLNIDTYADDFDTVTSTATHVGYSHESFEASSDSSEKSSAVSYSASQSSDDDSGDADYSSHFDDASMTASRKTSFLESYNYSSDSFTDDSPNDNNRALVTPLGISKSYSYSFEDSDSFSSSSHSSSEDTLKKQDESLISSDDDSIDKDFYSDGFIEPEKKALHNYIHRKLNVLKSDTPRRKSEFVLTPRPPKNRTPALEEQRFLQEKIKLISKKSQNDHAKEPNEKVRPSWSILRRKKAKDFGISQSVIEKLKLENLNRAVDQIVAEPIHDPSKCKECREEQEFFAAKEYIATKTMHVREQNMETKIQNHMLQYNPILMFGRGVHELPKHSENKQQIFDKLLLPLKNNYLKTHR